MRFVLALCSVASAALVLAPRFAAAQDAAPLMPPQSTPPAATPADAAPQPAPVAAADDQDKEKAAKEKEEKETHDKIEWLKRIRISGFVQPQLIWNWYNDAASPSAVGGKLPPGVDANSVIGKSDGSTTNSDFFKLRRARVKIEYMPTDFARFIMELDPTPTGGPSAGIGTIARQVEAQGIVKWGAGVTTEFGVGIFKLPFGYEVLQSDADRPFIERSWAENNMTPGEFDTGAHAYTSLLEKKLNIQLAVVNGQTQGEKQFAIVPDLNRGKDFVGRISYDFGPFDVGASGYYGQGQVVDSTALKFKQFQRHAFNIEAAFHTTLVEALGQTKILAEVTRGQNMDRGTKYAFALPSIPSDISQDVNDLDELGYWARIEQDLSKWFTVGARYDVYTPNSAEGNNSRETLGVVGVVNFTKGLKLMVEYDHAVDNVHKPGTAAPSKKIDTLSSVLQARF